MAAQRPLKRRQLFLLFAPSLLLGCGRRGQREVLEDLVRGAVTDLAQALSEESAALTAKVSRLQHNVASLDEARGAWQKAAIAWKRAQAFRNGPFTQGDYFQKAAFWPLDRPEVDALLSSGEPLDALAVQRARPSARGLSVLEYLLFEPTIAPTLTAEGPEGTRRRAYALELAVNVRGYAERLRRGTADPGTARSFASKGQASLEALCAQGFESLEITRGKLERARRAVASGASPHLALEGHLSGLSTKLAAALLEGTERLYTGGPVQPGRPNSGLRYLVAHESPEVDVDLQGAFRAVATSFAALGPQLDVAVAGRPSEFAIAERAVATLSNLWRTDLSTTLGVGM